MKITSIRTAVVEANYDWTYIRVYTDEGLTGTGESFFAPGLTAIVRDLGPVLVGEDPRDVDRLFRKLKAAVMGAGGLGGIVYNAITGIEVALWDIVGKHLGVPVYRLLGGKYRDRVQLYVDAHAGAALEALSPVLLPRRPSWIEGESPTPPDDGFSPGAYAKRAREMKERGYRCIKFDLDLPNPHGTTAALRPFSNRELDRMVALAMAARDAVGDDVDLAVDCHWSYNLNDAIRLAQALEPCRLVWIEDPVPPGNVSAMRAVTQATRTPTLTGENLVLWSAFEELIDAGAVRIVAPDLQKVGGLLEARRIADFADAHAVPVAPHNIASPIGTLASVHLCAAIPNFLALEFHGLSVPFWEDLATGVAKPLIQSGSIAVPEQPGIGAELDEAVARRYAKPGEPFFGASISS